jgi:hypothetical protein
VEVRGKVAVKVAESRWFLWRSFLWGVMALVAAISTLSLTVIRMLPVAISAGRDERRFSYQQRQRSTAGSSGCHDRARRTECTTVPAWPTRLITGVRRSVGRSEEVRNGSAAPFTGRGEATVKIRNT